eukprot:1140454-Pelagomonas_calceolata.AAC.1
MPDSDSGTKDIGSFSGFFTGPQCCCCPCHCPHLHAPDTPGTVDATGWSVDAGRICLEGGAGWAPSCPRRHKACATQGAPSGIAVAPQYVRSATKSDALRLVTTLTHTHTLLHEHRSLHMLWLCPFTVVLAMPIPIL